MRPLRTFTTLFLVFILAPEALLADEAANKPGTQNIPACFCLMNIVEGYFLVGCEDKTADGSDTKQASCRHPQTGKSGNPSKANSLPIKITKDWMRIESGVGTCEPCAYIRNDRDDPDTPRGGNVGKKND